MRGRTDEHPPVGSEAVVAAQTQRAEAVADSEHVRVVVRTGDGFHPDAEPLAFGLVLVSQAQGGSDFRRTELETQLDGASVEDVPTSAILEAELADGHGDQVQFDFGLGDLRLVQDLTGVVDDVVAVLLHGLFVVLRGLLEAEGDGLPNGEVAGLGHDGLEAQEMTNLVAPSRRDLIEVRLQKISKEPGVKDPLNLLPRRIFLLHNLKKPTRLTEGSIFHDPLLLALPFGVPPDCIIAVI